MKQIILEPVKGARAYATVLYLARMLGPLPMLMQSI